MRLRTHQTEDRITKTQLSASTEQAEIGVGTNRRKEGAGRATASEDTLLQENTGGNKTSGE